MNEIKVHASAVISGLLTIEREEFADKRGYFVALHLAGELDPWTPAPVRFEEDDLSASRHRVLRGLHGDDATWKLVQCVEGKVFLAVADLRHDSPTQGGVFHATLDSDRPVQVLIPPGCVNGHQCLSEHSLFIYKQSARYTGAGRQMTVRWDDPRLKIPWPLSKPILSDRDANATLLP
jgi:dTDP-4-dehydrorhamnose 3,5-epimerase